MSGPDRPRVAIAHDYLTQRGGAERVVLAMLRAFPGATIYTTLYDPDGTYPEFADARIVTSPLNRIGPLRRNHRAALPLLAWAAGTLRIDADVVVVSSSGWAHGFPTAAKRLVYCYSPARWLYQTETYLGGPPIRSAKGLIILALRPWLRAWDRRQAAKATTYLAISRVVQERIRDTYGLASEVVPAPHSYDAAAPQEPIDALGDWPDFHLVVSRLLPYKNVTPVVDAFAGLPEQRLVIIGRGPLATELAERAPANVRLQSGLSDAQMRWAYAHCTALIAPSFEDFGLTPLEAGVYGKPSLTLRAGGYLDTIAEGVTGAHFDDPSADSIRAAVVANGAMTWNAERIKAHVALFSEEHFAAALRERVDSLLA